MVINLERAAHSAQNFWRSARPLDYSARPTKNVELVRLEETSKADPEDEEALRLDKEVGRIRPGTEGTWGEQEVGNGD